MFPSSSLASTSRILTLNDSATSQTDTTAPSIQLVSEMDTIRAGYPADTRNRMGLDFICHNSFKYTCCLCSERILIHESELVLDKFFEKHNCPKRRSQSAPPDSSGEYSATSNGQAATIPNTAVAGDREQWNNVEQAAFDRAPTNKCKTRLSWYVEWLAYA